jgi:hypothetical protein
MLTYGCIIRKVLIALDSSRFSPFDQLNNEIILTDLLGFNTSFLFTNFRVKFLRKV